MGRAGFARHPGSSFYISGCRWFWRMELLLALWSPTGHGLQTGVLAPANSSDIFGERIESSHQECPPADPALMEKAGQGWGEGETLPTSLTWVPFRPPVVTLLMCSPAPHPPQVFSQIPLQNSMLMEKKAFVCSQPEHLGMRWLGWGVGDQCGLTASAGPTRF